ncbi:MAG: hypothetical protein EXQ58_10540 [Acidobacteria bacterium]|nr:hypothetical protein [Acidobacteriota bacterium]
MPLQPQDSPLGAFLKALREEKVDCILIGAMAAIQQGAPLMTVDYDFWVRLPERQYVRLLAIVQRQGGTVRARTLYELSDGTQVNAIFQPDGLRSFEAEWKVSRWAKLEKVPLKVLPLHRVIASKQAANREKDIAVLPVLRRTLRLARRLEERRVQSSMPVKKRRQNQSKRKLS